MKKGLRILECLAVIVIVILLTGLTPAPAGTDTTDNANTNAGSNINTATPVSQDVPNKGYQCLDAKIDGQSKLSFEQAVFAGLAVGKGKNDKILNTIKENKNSNEACWPAGGCRLKETAQVALYYQRIGEKTDDIIKWIESKSGTATGLKWYLEIDISDHSPAECRVSYDSSTSNIMINEEMKIERGSSGCFSVSSSGYWLQLADRCMDKTFEVSCSKDFLTTLLYEKKSSGTIYVSPETHNAAQDARTTEKIEAKCFKTGSECDYEGSLWASLALNKLGKDISSYIPYLQALEEDNQKHFPSAFIYFIQPAQEQYGKIIEQQKPGKFWEVMGSLYKKYYDTSLAIMALDRSSSVRTEVEQAKSYLASAQMKDGCWNARDSIIDTAFILFSAWPKGISGSGGGGGNGVTAFCKDVQGASCETDKNACQTAGGRELTIYTCLKANEFCCSVKVPAKTCSDQKGILCKTDEECLAETLDSSDSGICCSTQCAKKTEPNTCPASAECKNSCATDEEEVERASCTNGQICCSSKLKEEPRNYTWIMILIILIIILIILIIFRRKLQLVWYNWRGGVKSIPVTKPGAGGAGMPPMQSMGPRPPFSPGMARPPIKPAMPIRQSPQAMSRISKDKELEETMKKLREMTK